MKIVVDKQLCTGHARCFAARPELFPLDELGYVEISEREIPAELEEDAQAGVAACPERAISVVD